MPDEGGIPRRASIPPGRSPMVVKRLTYAGFAAGRRRRWLVAFALATLLLALSIRSASAAASLSVSENPVTIGSGQSSKTVTLSWTLDAGQKATLTVKDNNQTVVLGPVAL